MSRRQKSLTITGALVAGVLASSLGTGTATAASVTTWDKVAQCESGGNWSINTGNTYYGGLQISLYNWQHYGGTAYATRPDLATKRQQILIAEKILADQGAGAWTCSPGTGLATDHAVPYASNAGTESGGAGRVRWADFDGDGKADYVIVNDNGSVHVFLNKGGDGRGGWQDLGQVATGITNDKSRIRFADFDGDGKADYITLDNNGAVNVYLNKGGDNGGGWQNLGKVATGLTANPDQVRFADFDGDGKTDYITLNADGAVNVFQNTGGDGRGGWKDLGKVATGVTNDLTRIRFADMNGDGKADYNIINPDGSVTSYTNKGGDTGGGWTLRTKITTGITTNQNLLDFADINGDNRADYLVTNGATTAFLNNGGDDAGGWIDYGQIATGA